MIKEPVLWVDYKLLITCPACGEELDLADVDYDNDGEFSSPIFSNRWDDLKGVETNCSSCGHEFKIESVERF